MRFYFVHIAREKNIGGAALSIEEDFKRKNGWELVISDPGIVIGAPDGVTKEEIESFESLLLSRGMSVSTREANEEEENIIKGYYERTFLNKEGLAPEMGI